MNKLISMVDFVLNVPMSGMEVQSIGIQGNNRYQKCIRYAKFLKQPIELWMFVPCDFEGNVLEESRSFYEATAFWNAGEIDEKHNDLVGEWEEAKERCLFEGFEIKDLKLDSGNKCVSKDDILHVFWQNEISKEFTLSKGISKIEDLVKYKLELTPTAIKQIGL